MNNLLTRSYDRFHIQMDTAIDHGEHLDSRNNETKFEPPMNRKRHDILQSDISISIRLRTHRCLFCFELQLGAVMKVSLLLCP